MFWRKRRFHPGPLRLLLKTRNSQLWERGEKEFDEKFVGISADGAEWLVQHGVKLIGIDYLSVAPYKQSVPTHRTLLGAGMIIVEGLDLSAVPPGSYGLYCLPLKLVGSDGAPAQGDSGWIKSNSRSWNCGSCSL